MNEQIIGSIYTLAGGVVLYSVKEIFRYFTDSNLQRKKINLEQIYPIYLDCFKKAKRMIGAYIIPTEQHEFLDFFDIEVFNNLDKQSKKAYENVIGFRQMINLSNRVKAMEDFKMSFNNEFSTNQIFFNPSFVMETIAIINEYQKDISYLKNIINKMNENRSYNHIDSFITSEYRRKINDYNLYLDKFEEQFSQKFKINRTSIKERIIINLNKRRFK
ncbi:TPA: hypothetical protein OYH51_002511 [Staphylococcus aureus]|nr:hypothetical protein [Staphylococcus aureus]